MNIRSIKTENYNYILPDKRIAKYPLPNRVHSKLLVYNKGNITHKQFLELPELISRNDLLIFNNTKVIQARLIFYKPTGAKIEVFCLEPVSPPDYAMIFQENETCTWKCIIGNLKKWKQGNLHSEVCINNFTIKVIATKKDAEDNSQIIQFTWNNKNISFGDILEHLGQTPIPPYLNRSSEISDKESYQTVYSKLKGSVAAPTAGLHFTDKLLKSLIKKNIKTNNITLHVGAGTFKPVKSEMIGGHSMHTEQFIIDRHLLSNLIKNLENITATGTTTVRTLESLYWLGVKLKINNNTDFHIYQWEVYDLPQNIEVKDALHTLLLFMTKHEIHSLNASTQIIIVPGYKFRLINKLITNFHQPKSTLLLLIAAFIGEDWKKVYDYALNNDFRFLSYGDSSILIP